MQEQEHTNKAPSSPPQRVTPERKEISTQGPKTSLLHQCEQQCDLELQPAHKARAVPLSRFISLSLWWNSAFVPVATASLCDKQSCVPNLPTRSNLLHNVQLLSYEACLIHTASQLTSGGLPQKHRSQP